MNKKYIKINQNNFIYYCINLSVDELLDIYSIQFFNGSESDGYGYQRLPKKSHYIKLAKYLMEDDKPILIPALIGAISKNEVYIGKDSITINGKIAIVDGQHRIEAFKYIQSKYPEKYDNLKNQEFLVELMVIDEDERYIEVSTFIDINSKNKKVDLDLAIQLKHKLIAQKKSDIIGVDFYSTEVLNNLNKDHKSVWYNMVKVGNDLDRKIISSKAFQRSIIDIVEIISKEISVSEEIIDKCVIILNDSWNIIKSRWPECFKEPFNYNIQKGVGVFPLHMIISEILNNIYDEQAIINKEVVKNRFQKIINAAKIECFDWVIGETFSKYNSKAGFKHIKEIIEGKEGLDHSEQEKSIEHNN